MSGSPISRRRAIGLATLGAASVAGGTVGWMTSAGSSNGGFHPAETGAPLRAPMLLDSREGRLRVELTAAPEVALTGRRTEALGYNGTSPGPTLRVRPGDELSVRLTNRLEQPTNLHTHGLRVSPQDNGDNPFLRIEPGTSFDYLFRIPPDHPAGTFWYHPHRHGLVADQVFGGLAGALLVSRGQDLPVERDQVLLVTDTTLDDGGAVAEPGRMEGAKVTWSWSTASISPRSARRRGPHSGGASSTGARHGCCRCGWPGTRSTWSRSTGRSCPRRWAGNASCSHPATVPTWWCARTGPGGSS